MSNVAHDSLRLAFIENLDARGCEAIRSDLKPVLATDDTDFAELGFPSVESVQSVARAGFLCASASLRFIPHSAFRTSTFDRFSFFIPRFYQATPSNL